MCTENGNRQGEVMSAEFTRIVGAIADAEGEAEEQERMAEVKRQRVQELKETLQRTAIAYSS